MVDVKGCGNRWVFSSLGGFVGPYHPLYCVDGCNGFDPFSFVTAARKDGRDPQEVLENIFISRVFTCHQMTAVVREELPKIVDQPNTPLVAILGISDLFYDEALPFWEREYLYRRTLDHLKILRGKGLLTLVTFRDRLEGSGARLWRWLLQHTADGVMRIEEQWSGGGGRGSGVGMFHEGSLPAEATYLEVTK
jgi:hypothetical protein